MKIIQISAVYKIGSVGKIVADIHSYLESQGVDSYVLYGVGRDVENKKKVIKSTSKFERYFSHLYYLVTGINFTGCFFGTRKIIRTIKKLAPDVVHIHCYNDYYMNIHMLLRWLNKHNKKVMLTQHSEHYYTGSCGHSLNCTKWKNGGCDSKCHFFEHHIKGYPFFDRSKLMWKKMYKSLSSFNKDNLTVVSCTPWLDERMKQSIIMKGVVNHTVIPNGTDINIFKYYQHAQDNKKIILFVTPRFEDEIKGSKYINDIANTFLNDESISFHLVGNIPNNYQLERNIVGIGPLYGEELAKEYSRANVTIMLSKAECFPMVIVESLLCGTKVVAFRCGGPDNSFNKEMASFVEWGNFTKMHNEIVSVISKPYDKKYFSFVAKQLYSKGTMSYNYWKKYKIQE